MAQNKANNKKAYLSTAELAKYLGVSRIAVFKKIQKGQIKAEKFGRNYVISEEEVATAMGQFISPEKKKEIKTVVKRAVKDYHKALQRLGRE